MQWTAGFFEVLFFPLLRDVSSKIPAGAATTAVPVEKDPCNYLPWLVLRLSLDSPRFSHFDQSQFPRSWISKVPGYDHFTIV